LATADPTSSEAAKMINKEIRRIGIPRLNPSHCARQSIRLADNPGQIERPSMLALFGALAGADTPASLPCATDIFFGE